MVRGLVQQQDVRWCDELASESDAAALAAAQLRRAVGPALRSASNPSPCSTASTRGAMV